MSEQDDKIRAIEDRVTVLANRAWNQAVRYMDSGRDREHEYRAGVDDLRDEILSSLAELRA